VSTGDAGNGSAESAAENAAAKDEDQPEYAGAPAHPITPAVPRSIDITDGAGLPGLRAAIEAVLMVVDTPVTDGMLAQVLERPREEIARTLSELAESYRDEGRGFELREVAGGWRLYSAAACAPYVERFITEGQPARLTQAALETLAVVAYRQPVSRARVSAVRGVNVEGVMRTLVSRGLVEEAGSEPESGAILYRTTSYFLERLGLRSTEDLPELAPFLPDIEGLDADVG
jgi:segregation and condensation protein B